MSDLQIIRKFKTGDAYFGDVTWQDVFQCHSMERIAVSIPEGSYKTTLELSPHFRFQTPHLQVPGRTYIEIHPANWPSQLEGCIAVGVTEDGDALDTSKDAFDALMLILPQEFVTSVVSEII
jgi:hypothetical protein